MVKEYKVLKITEMIRPRDEGGIEKFYRHQIRTRGGVTLNIDIDEKDFIPEKADPVLTKAAENADKVLKLGG